jgi:hypothetical protein
MAAITPMQPAARNAETLAAWEGDALRGPWLWVRRWIGLVMLEFSPLL